MVIIFYEKFVIKTDDEGRRAFFDFVNSLKENRPGSITYTTISSNIYTIYAYQDREDDSFNKLMKYLQSKDIVTKEDF